MRNMKLDPKRAIRNRGVLDSAILFRRRRFIKDSSGRKYIPRRAMASHISFTHETTSDGTIILLEARR